MKKFRIKSFVAVILTLAMCFSFNFSVFAVSKNSSGSKSTAKSVDTDQMVEKLMQQAKKDLKAKTSSKKESTNKIKLGSPAPALTDAYIYAIESEGHDSWDYFPKGQSTVSNYTHSGEAYVATVEVGYGNGTYRHLLYNKKECTLKEEDPVPSHGEAKGFICIYYIPNVSSGGKLEYKTKSEISPYLDFYDWKFIK